MEESKPSAYQGQPAAATEPAITLPAAAATPPVREDQIQNAVAFLSHPKVTDSPPASKRSFLERKGLTGPEIEEAFARARGSSAPTSALSSAAAVQPYGTSQAAVSQGPSKPFPQKQPVEQQHETGALALRHGTPQAMVAAHPPALAQPQGLRWPQVVIGMGLTAAAVVAVQQYVYPYLAEKYRQLGAKARERAEAAEQREQLLLDTIKGLQDNQKELQEQLAGVGTLVKSLKEEVVASSSRNTAAGAHAAPGHSAAAQDARDMPWQPARDYGATRPNWGSSYRDSQQYSQGGWSGSNGHSNGGQPYKRTVQDDHWRGSAPVRPGSSPSSERAAPNPSYEEVVKMLQQGITPPNVRTDINDQPPDPSRPFSESRAALSAKPWQRGVGGSSTDSDIPASQPPRTPNTNGVSTLYPCSPAPGATAHAPAASGYSPGLAAYQHEQQPPTSLAHRSPSSSCLHSEAAGSGAVNVLSMESTARDASRINVPAAGSGPSSGSGGSGGSSGGGVWPVKQDVWRPPPPPAPTVTGSRANVAAATEAPPADADGNGASGAGSSSVATPAGGASGSGVEAGPGAGAGPSTGGMDTLTAEVGSDV